MMFQYIDKSIRFSYICNQEITSKGEISMSKKLSLSKVNVTGLKPEVSSSFVSLHRVKTGHTYEGERFFSL